MGLYNVTKEFSQMSDAAEVFMHPTDECFYCGETLLGDWFIYWQGADEKGQQIWLHMDCAKRLVDALNKDFHHFLTGVKP
jgi:hypothetical protein